MWTKQISETVTSEKKGALGYTCSCLHRIAINYTAQLRNKVSKLHGQGMPEEGYRTEKIVLETSLPDYLQCSSCGDVHKITIPSDPFLGPQFGPGVIYVKRGEEKEEYERGIRDPRARESEMLRMMKDISLERIGIPLKV